MGRTGRTLAVAAVLLGLVAASCSSSSDGAAGRTRPTTDATTDVQAHTLGGRAEDAYLAGLPLVTTARTMQTFAGLVGVNTLLRTAKLSDASSRFIVAPNHDTLYAIAILDLRGGPVALTLPKIDRYNTFQVIDAWMDTIANVGTRATGGEAGTWVFTPPGSTAALPAGAHRIASPTNRLILLGRVRAVDDADAKGAFAATAQARLQPLSRLTGGPAQPAAPAAAKPPGTPSTAGTDGLAYWDELGDALAIDPAPDHARRQAIAGAADLGVGPGLHPTATTSAADQATLTTAATDGNQAVEDSGNAGGKDVDGWRVNLDLGDPKAAADLRTKAVVARHFWGPNVAAESVYPVAEADRTGRPLTGARSYRIHIPAGGEPPVGAFWSYTAYDADSYLVDNPIHRFSISGQTPGLVRGANGSLDLYLSADAPAGHEANWLPVPRGPFRLVLRLYLPGKPILDGTYHYPTVDPT